MSYATPEQLRVYALDLETVTIPEDDNAVERLLARASQDVDRAIGPVTPRATDTLKYDPEILTDAQAAALADATCAQAIHRLVLGPDYFDAEPEDLLTADVRILRPAQRISPRVPEILAGHGLITRSGTLVPPPPPVA